MVRVGYARVSSQGQSLDVQLEKLAFCDKFYQEKKSGKNDKRSELTAALDYVREGDSLVVTRIDRLARSTLHLCQIADLLETKGVDLVVIDQSIDTSTPTGKLLFNMLAAIAQFETEIRSERQMEGIASAKDKGVVFGRKSALSDHQVEQLKQKRNDGVLIRVLMNEYKLSKAAIYKYLSAK